MLKLVNMFLLVGVLVTGYGAFAVKYMTQDLHYRLSLINQQIKYEEENVVVLKAELAYLKSPNRIRALAHKYMDYTEMGVLHVVSDPLSDSMYTYTAACANGVNIHHENSKWRYKKYTAGKFIIISNKK